MKKTKLQKGITLIALIITIIILLILAVVTIGSIRDSKIIDYAQDAASEYTVAQEKEQIGLALREWQIERYTSGKSFKEVVSAALSGTASVVENSDGTLTVTMETGNQYILTDSGEILPPTKGILLSPTSIIINEGETEKITVSLLGGLSGDITYSSSDVNVATVSTEGVVTGEGLGTATITVTCGEYSATCQVGVSNIEEYFFGNNEQVVGRPLSEIATITSTGVVLKNDAAPIFQGNVADINLLESIQIDEWGYTYFEYQGMYYKARVNMTSSEVDGVSAGYTDENYGMKIIDIQGERIGKTVKYDNKLWTIIYDDSTNGLQMLSNESLDWDSSYEFQLGGSDSLKIDWNNIKDLNENNSIDRFEESIHSYNNAIKTLNIACDNIVADSKYIKEVRCVGTNPIDKDAENKIPYTSEQLGIWPTSSAGIINGEAKGTDENFISDYERMLVLGKLQTGDCYWLGSRFIYEAEEILNFALRRYNITYLEESEIFCVSQAEVKNIGAEDELRPVVVLNSDANLVEDSTDAADYVLQ